MSSGETVAEKLDDDWRMTCPERHHSLHDKKGPTVYCEKCNSSYRYEDLIDKAERDSSSRRIGLNERSDEDRN